MNDGTGRTFGPWVRELFGLDPAVTYLNHGTVGAAPRRVLEAQQRWRQQMERQPSAFLLRELTPLGLGLPRPGPGRLREAAALVAAFVGSRSDDLVFVDNATAGANAVLRSLDLRPGDEILLTDHTYGAVANAATFRARECSAQVRTVEVPYPTFDAKALVAAVDQALGSRTRLLVIDHITSESALVLPVAEIAARARAKGVSVLVDGAHAPGAIPLDVPGTGADYYTANLHKWAFAPKGCGFLWAKAEKQAGLHPPVISWGLDKGFIAEFDWVGTRDPSPWLCAPKGIAFLQELGASAVQRWNHDLAWEAARRLSERWGTPLGVPESSVGTMVTLPLPAGLGSTRDDAARLRDALLFEDGIEVQLHATRGRLWTRVSAQVYNDRDDIDRLGDKVAARIP